ncbi:alpha/beta fold hydrolase [Streptomyces antibioticus]|uniref:alpha/beta fold hydrolase n=1 Tax=Streptomyces antibioticus TaxID=1890 RepID=UPI0036A4556D
MASDVAAVANALDVERFAAMGHSGGGAHLLACAALLPNRVLGVVDMAGPAPFGAEGLDWFEGMTPAIAASLRAAAQGRGEKEKHAAGAEYDPETFTAADRAALAGEGSWLDDVVAPAVAAGPGGQIDDDLAYSPRGAPTRGGWACRSSSKATRTASRPAHTRKGSQTTVRRPNCGCAPETDTSLSSPPARPPWSGSRNAPPADNAGDSPEAAAPPAPLSRA